MKKKSENQQQIKKNLVHSFLSHFPLGFKTLNFRGASHETFYLSS